MAPTHDSVIEQLLEALLDSGRSVEEVCREHPELLAQVRQRWQRVRQVQEQVDELFPSAGSADTGPTTSPAALPSVPGYVVERELGRGGMGVVYRARHERLQRTVAIKMLLTGPFASKREQLRFQREAELVAQLQHPNIIAIHDVGDLGGLPWYTMELIDGPSLQQRLRDGPLPPLAAARLCSTLARAVEFAHQHGIVHRDLKPANILLAADGTPRIGDFGLARRIGAPGVTISGGRVGTPRYMSPEQASGLASAVGPATDVHALGVVLYELLAGHPPFRGENDTETTRAVIEEQPPRLRAAGRRIPRDLETICLHCLRKEPHRRYASAALLADDLDRFAAGVPVLARRAGRLEHVWAWARRRRALALALASSVLLALALLLGGIWLSIDHTTVLRAVERDLAAVLAHERDGRWEEARAALRAAEARLGERSAPALRTALAATRADLELVAALERVRVQRVLRLEGRRVVPRPSGHVEGKYEALLAGSGADDPARPLAEVATALRASPVCSAIVAALDDWAFLTSDGQRRDRLLAVLQQADSDGGGWRARLRDPACWQDLPALQALAADPDVERQPVMLVMALADRIDRAGGDAKSLLERAMTHHPHDFWLNITLGLLCAETREDEATRYLQAAIAVRPEEASGYVYLGIVLSSRGRFTAGEQHLRRALALRPEDAWVHSNLGVCLHRQRRYAEAIAAFEAALARSPDLVSSHVGLAASLAADGQTEAAMRTMLEAERLDPDDDTAQAGLGLLLHGAGNPTDAEPRFQRAVQRAPDNAEHHQGLARTLLALGRHDDAVAAARTALRLDPSFATRRTDLGIVLREAGLMQEAIRAHEQACALPDATAADHHGHAIALAIDWQYDAAVAEFQRTLQLEPAHDSAQGGLVQALLMAGRFHEAIPAARRYSELAQGEASVTRAKAMLGEAERLAALTGEHLREDLGALSGIDCLHLARHAASQDRVADALRCYEAGFRRSPRLADDVRGGARLHAARLALRAASGAGANDDEKRALRERALAWLTADLAFRKARWPRVDARLRTLLVDYADRQQSDPALVVVRDAAALAALPPAERNAWLDHWGELAAWLRTVAPR